MQWRLWGKSGSQELPAVVKNTLMSQFGMTPESVEKLRFLGQPGRQGNQRVQSIRVFDPALISGGAGGKAKYLDLGLQFSGDRKALVFEGYLAEDGTVFLTDRRPSMVAH
ncbi:MAG: hypothetical protein BZY83_08745 [SAR202 cluster bacterium Casp-Chloro-G2]|nr:MAG: hypothetical protein BZY83_08745 [SAR202 cluster bacterium Casp-Chloro-G2]